MPKNTCPINGESVCTHASCHHYNPRQIFASGAMIKKPPEDLSRAVKDSFKKLKIAK